MSNHFSEVMAGLVPAIHDLLTGVRQQRRGCPRQSPDQVRGRAWRGV